MNGKERIQRDQELVAGEEESDNYTDSDEGILSELAKKSKNLEVHDLRKVAQISLSRRKLKKKL